MEYTGVCLSLLRGNSCTLLTSINNIYRCGKYEYTESIVICLIYIPWAGGYVPHLYSIFLSAHIVYNRLLGPPRFRFDWRELVSCASSLRTRYRTVCNKLGTIFSFWCYDSLSLIIWQVLLHWTTMINDLVYGCTEAISMSDSLFTGCIWFLQNHG